MAAQAGRKARIRYDADGIGAGAAAVIAGARVDSVTINNEPIDITDKDDAGIQHLLNDIGKKTVGISCEGVLLDDTLLTLAHDAGANSSLHYFEWDTDGIANIRGRFFINSFEASGTEGTEPVTFTMTCTSHDTTTLTSS